MSTIEAPERRYRIAEVGRLTGFTPTTLRFYENAGVLPPPQRTPAGYRVYDDRAVERLRLIARAKELGCTLEEIAGLVEAWDADECGPVKHRLRSVVSAKVAEIQRHIAEQVAFAAQLQATAASLAGRPVDGPCDESCGCTATIDAEADADTGAGGESADAGGCGCGTGASADAVMLTAGGAAASPPIACSLAGGDMQARIGEWQALLAGVDHREAITDGLRLVFTQPAPLGEITRLAAIEHDCCPFFGFTVTIDGRGIALEVTAPPDGHVVLASVFGVAP
ncbi:MAG TPA: MerR family transcriptional regulator [Acidimicrobiales bacterium]|nr:MerR family transcriptional regulator [Acidimicrobiales bacterium]